MPNRHTWKDELPANRDVEVRKYTHARGLAHSALEPCGTLRWDGAQVALQATDSLLRDFLTLLEAAQEELNQRWNDQEKSGCHADRA
ncbi:hypothetical protein [Streptomyces turgidiscabies]|uniref:Uncharacterized protein n=1 Tax=Streptomyces turgidiscabies TaxID=85558 RepID=A0ABU0RQS2_9ACTN|nr:hypothetical protein [Streptomyces turgidiscabies]MDQ0934331.1 hypothetical protein [Streptomyces turgidiscabies]